MRHGGQEEPRFGGGNSYSVLEKPPVGQTGFEEGSVDQVQMNLVYSTKGLALFLRAMGSH